MIYFTDTGDIVQDKNDGFVTVLSSSGVCKKASGFYNTKADVVTSSFEVDATEEEFREFVWTALWALHSRMRRGI